MRKVDLQLARLECPDYCCRCGDTPAEIRTYSERMALRGLGLRPVRAQVPVCKRCANRKIYFYPAALVALGLAILGFKLAAGGVAFGRYLSVLFLVALGLYIVAVKSTPIKIMDYRPRTDTITLGCLHEGFAADMAALSGGTNVEYVRLRKSLWIFVLLALAGAVLAMSLGF